MKKRALRKQSARFDSGLYPLFRGFGDLRRGREHVVSGRLRLFPLFDGKLGAFREPVKHGGHVSRLRYHYFRDEVYKPEELFCRCSVVLKVYLSRVDSVVANYPHNVQSLNHPHVQPFSRERANITVDVLSTPTQFLAEFLNA
jgi:hypothetical protein